jgi:hypothetical protein
MGESHAFKPALISHYIATKGGIDVVDKLAREYTTCRGTRQTILQVHLSFLWLIKHPEWKIKVRHRRRHFLIELGDQMVCPYIIQRASNFSLNKPIRVAMEAIGVNPKLQNPTATTPSIQEERTGDVATYVPEHQTGKQNSGVDHVKTTLRRRM